MERAQKNPEEVIPLTPAVFHILLALSEGERHGYAVMREVNRQTGGALRLGPGTLYTAIRRLLDAGLIEEAPPRPVPEPEDERRRYYRLTEFGRRVAAAEAERHAALVALAEAKRLLNPRRPNLAGEPAP